MAGAAQGSGRACGAACHAARRQDGACERAGQGGYCRALSGRGGRASVR